MFALATSVGLKLVGRKFEAKFNISFDDERHGESEGATPSTDGALAGDNRPDLLRAVLNWMRCNQTVRTGFCSKFLHS